MAAFEDSNSPPGPSLQSPGDTISEEEVRMAVALSEYFQEQRRLQLRRVGHPILVSFRSPRGAECVKT